MVLLKAVGMVNQTFPGFTVPWRLSCTQAEVTTRDEGPTSLRGPWGHSQHLPCVSGKISAGASAFHCSDTLRLSDKYYSQMTHLPDRTLTHRTCAFYFMLATSALTSFQGEPQLCLPSPWSAVRKETAISLIFLMSFIHYESAGNPSEAILLDSWFSHA